MTPDVAMKVKTATTFMKHLHYFACRIAKQTASDEHQDEKQSGENNGG
jgi:hypothetical protein